MAKVINNYGKKTSHGTFKAKRHPGSPRLTKYVKTKK